MQPDLFDRMEKAAELSPCGAYRLRLSRVWDRVVTPAVFVMLNPSTADAEKDDPTVRRCIGFAGSWGCGGLVVVNLFAFRATDPADLAKAAAPIGPDNDQYVRDAAREGSPVVAAWGAHAPAAGRAAVVRYVLDQAGVPLKALGFTKEGFPRHPLYVRGDAPLIDYPFA